MINYVLMQYVTLVCGFFLNDKLIIIVQQVVKYCVMIYEEFMYDCFEHSGRLWNEILEFPLLRMRSMCMNGYSYV